MMNKTLQIQKIREFINNNTEFSDDVIDVEALVDGSLTYTENLNIIKSKLMLLPPNSEKIEAEIKEEYNKYINEKKEKELEEIRKSTTANIDKYFWKLEKFIDVLLKSKNTCLFLLGDPALGKSYNTIRILKKNNVKFMSKSGNITPLELYNFLYDVEKSDSEVVIFDDTQSLVNNVQAMSLLMEAMWSIDGVRIVNWDSSTQKISAPKKFEFTKKIIFILNQAPKTTMMEVLLTRTMNYNVDFDYDTRIKIMYEICKIPHKQLSREEREEIVDFIKENTDASTIGMNLRLQKKLEEIYIHEKDCWKELALTLMNKDKELEVVYRLINECSTIKDAERRFVSQGLGSRSTFYRYKRRLRI